MRTLSLVAAMLAAGGAVAAGTSPPPARYVDEGACPFECCTYRDWTVQRATSLLVRPEHGAPQAAVVRPGQTVQALTGKVVVSRPGEFVVLHQPDGDSGARYAVGDRVYVYTPLGEGYFRVWHAGRMYEEEATFLYDGIGASFDACERDGSCWGRRVALPRYTWWVKMRTPSGVVGWWEEVVDEGRAIADEPPRFGNLDACG